VRGLRSRTTFSHRCAIPNQQFQMNAPTYYLRRQAFVCFSNRHYIMLDLLADMYFRMEKGPFEAVADCIHLSPPLGRSVHDSLNPELSVESRALLGELLARRLLTENPDQANNWASESLAIPVETLIGDKGTVSFASCLRHIFSFVAASRAAAHWLKGPIAQTVSRVKERKSRRAYRSARFNVDRERFLIAVFCQLRPFYNRQYLCLFDSLALLNFLARYDIFPTWVFGVQSEPFNAHCWVQNGGFLLNDTADRVGIYTPILAV
jgi:Transglutaminase-like superfamily